MSRFTHQTRPLLGSGASSRVSQFAQRSMVKSVQRSTIAVTGGTTGTATITAVDINTSRLVYLGQTASTSTIDPTKFCARLTFTNGTTITATVNTSPGAATCTVSFEVIEYYPGAIKSVQRSTLTTSASSPTATINSVATNKTQVDFLGFSDADTSGNNGVFPYVVLTNSTTVTATNTVAANAVVGFQVVEWF